MNKCSSMSIKEACKWFMMLMLVCELIEFTVRQTLKPLMQDEQSYSSWSSSVMLKLVAGSDCCRSRIRVCWELTFICFAEWLTAVEDISALRCICDVCVCGCLQLVAFTGLWYVCDIFKPSSTVLTGHNIQTGQVHLNKDMVCLYHLHSSSQWNIS